MQLCFGSKNDESAGAQSLSKTSRLISSTSPIHIAWAVWSASPSPLSRDISGKIVRWKATWYIERVCNLSCQRPRMRIERIAHCSRNLFCFWFVVDVSVISADLGNLARRHGPSLHINYCCPSKMSNLMEMTISLNQWSGGTHLSRNRKAAPISGFPNVLEMRSANHRPSVWSTLRNSRSLAPMIVID